MKLDTKYFGEIQCTEDDVLRFPGGLFGFEDETQFLLLPFGSSDSNLLCLQSVKTPRLAFVVMNPFLLSPSYAPKLQEDELTYMHVKTSQDLCYYVLCAVREPVSESTVNLKCPVVINDETRTAFQVILESGDYGMRHRLSEFQTREAGGTC